jgi:hypothetical protein
MGAGTRDSHFKQKLIETHPILAAAKKRGDPRRGTPRLLVQVFNWWTAHGKLVTKLRPTAAKSAARPG